VSDHYKLADHEWKTHGTCSGFKDSTTYFETALKTLKNVPGDGKDGTPTLLEDAANSNDDNPTVNLRNLASVYPKKALFGCDRVSGHQCRLVQIITCYDATNAPDVGDMVDCPAWSVHSHYDNSCYLDHCDDELLLYS